ncbi:uncharacterized protein AB9W97_016279 isoform 2-T2 [Spinachia spinachia]
METKVFVVLCSLLLVNFGSTNHDEDHAAAASSLVSPPHVPQAPELVASPAASLPNTRQGLSGTVATEEESTSVTPDPKTAGEIVLAGGCTACSGESEDSAPERRSTPPPLTAPPPTSPTCTHPHTGPTPPPITTYQDSVTASDQPTRKSPRPPPTSSSSSPSSTSSSAAPPSSEWPTLTPLQTTTPAHRHPEALSQAPRTLSTDPPSSFPPQAKSRPDSPAQINVRDDTTMVHDPPTLDPLLAGLVSAFIITAVIITMLLFLKLRRREARLEFRRLQDLPMDDMMEDTPLSRLHTWI